MVMYMMEKYAKLNAKMIIVKHVQVMEKHVQNVIQGINYIMVNAL